MPSLGKKHTVGAADRTLTNASSPLNDKNIPQPERIGGYLVPLTGLEPVRYCYRGILSPFVSADSTTAANRLSILADFFIFVKGTFEMEDEKFISSS